MSNEPQTPPHSKAIGVTDTQLADAIIGFIALREVTIAQLQAAIQRVRDLHKEIDSYCAECKRNFAFNFDWPCSTIQALVRDTQ